MIRNLKRLIFAFLVSAGCFAGTVYWYESGQIEIASSEDSKPIAQLRSHVNDIQRKPVTRVIWESISENEQLYAGETIRTASDAEAKILFLSANTLIELEPDSMIAIEENDGAIALNFLQGNLFVKSAGGKSASGAPTLKLKTGKSEISLRGAEVSLAQNNQGQVDLQVFKGTAEVKQGEKVLKVEENNGGQLSEKGVKKQDGFLQVLSPTSGYPIYVNPETQEEVVFSWKPLNKGYSVQLEWGARSKRMTNRSVEVAKGEVGKLKSQVKLGNVYWRLVATSSDPAKDKLFSQTYKTQIIAKIPPVLLEPKNEQQIVLKPDQSELNFSWVSQMELDDTVLELSKTKDFMTKVKVEELMPKQTFASISLRKSDLYYWRITGKLKYLDQNGQTKIESISSPIRMFTLRDEINLVPPQLKSPMPDQNILYTQITDSGLFMTWDELPGIKNYKVSVMRYKDGVWSKKPKIYDVAYSPLRLEKIGPGVYSWHVFSQNTEGRTSKASEVRQFTVTDIPQINFAGGNGFSEIYYYTDKPSLYVQWFREKHTAVFWKYKYFQKNNEDSAKVYKTNKLGFRKSVSSDGEWNIVVQGYDQKNRLVAKSNSKIVHLKTRPLLPSPKFTKSMPEILKSTNSGELSVEWSAVDGAKKYQVQLIDQSGQALQQKQTDRTMASLTSLKPGNYKLQIQSIDEHKRVGPITEEREVVVPKNSSIKAPKIRNFKVN